MRVFFFFCLFGFFLVIEDYKNILKYTEADLLLSDIHTVKKHFEPELHCKEKTRLTVWLRHVTEMFSLASSAQPQKLRQVGVSFNFWR